MSNYTQIVSYGPKDSLSHGDPNKALKGVQIDAELGAISTAIASKLDSALTNLAVGGTSNNYSTIFTGSATANQSLGVAINAGTSASDISLLVTNRTGTPYLEVRGDGRLLAGSLDFTPTSGSFSSTLSGTGSGSVTLLYFKVGPLVTIYNTSGSVTGTGNGTSSNILNMSSFPAAICPTTTIYINAPMFFPAASPPPFTNQMTVSLTSAGVASSVYTNGAIPAVPYGFAKGFMFQYVIV